MDRDSQVHATNASDPGMPPLAVLRDMLDDFANLHSRLIPVVVGHELSSHGRTFPPLDMKNEFIVLMLKLRDPNANPASVFEFTGGIVPCPIDDLDAEKRQLVLSYAESLSKTNEEFGLMQGRFYVPVMRELVYILVNFSY